MYQARSIGIINPDLLTLKIVIIGAGSVGSYTTLCLAKMGASNLHVYDPEKVEAVNVGCQLYNPEDIDNFKVNALQEIVGNLADQEIRPYSKKYDGSEADIYISCVDTMKARTKILELIADHDGFYIDSRMGGQYLTIFSTAINGTQIEKYAKTLKNDTEPEPCSARSISYNNFIIAGLISNQVKKIVKEEEYPYTINFDLEQLSFMRSKPQVQEEDVS